MINFLKIVIYTEWLQLKICLIDRLLPLLFFLLAVLIFPLAISSDPILLKAIAPGVIWVVVLFANILTFDQIWRVESQEGTLEQYLLSSQSVTALVYIKILMHWLLTALPLIMIAPILAAIFHLQTQENSVLFLSLLIGTPILSLMGTLLSALTLKLQSTHFLLFLLLVPLLIPILILGVTSVSLVGMGTTTQGLLLLLLAINIGCLSVLPWVTGVLLKLMV